MTLLVALASSHLYASQPQSWRVVFPNLALKKNSELLEKLHLIVNCGHIESVGAIPAGWSISVVRMNAGVEELRAEADHGASRLWELGRFNGGIRVVPEDAECFTLSATVVVSGEATREIGLPREKLRLLP
jgi:hypothetical protein